MILELAHTKLTVFISAKQIVKDVYRITSEFPTHEKYGLTSQMRRAAVSIVLNISEGCSRKSQPERKRFFEIARGSLIELDTAIDISIELKYLQKEKVDLLNHPIINVFKILSKLISS